MSSVGGGEKTEKATPKKRREERERGNVFKSHDMSVAISLLGTFSVLRILSPTIGRGMQSVFMRLLPGMPSNAETLTITVLNGYGLDTIMAGLTVLIPFFLFVAASEILINAVQTRFLFTGKGFAVKAERISLASGFKRMFSMRSAVETFKSIAKISVVIAAITGEFVSGMQQMPALSTLSLPLAIQTVFDRIVKLAMRGGLVLLIIAVLDYVYQWWRHEKDLRMTKEEVKQEYKLTEGNPQTRGRVRQIQRTMATRRMMSAVPAADVVVTNPTHYAIAMRYDAKKEAAPIVLAKGKGHVALRIKEIAKENKIILVENRPLTRAIYATCEIGQQIPANLYQAVAEVLAYVAKIKKGVMS